MPCAYLDLPIPINEPTNLQNSRNLVLYHLLCSLIFLLTCIVHRHPLLMSLLDHLFVHGQTFFPINPVSSCSSSLYFLARSSKSSDILRRGCLWRCLRSVGPSIDIPAYPNNADAGDERGILTKAADSFIVWARRYDASP